MRFADLFQCLVCWVAPAPECSSKRTRASFHRPLPSRPACCLCVSSIALRTGFEVDASQRQLLLRHRRGQSPRRQEALALQLVLREPPLGPSQHQQQRLPPIRHQLLHQCQHRRYRRAEDAVQKLRQSSSRRQEAVTRCVCVRDRACFLKYCRHVQGKHSSLKRGQIAATTTDMSHTAMDARACTGVKHSQSRKNFTRQQHHVHSRTMCRARRCANGLRV